MEEQPLDQSQRAWWLYERGRHELALEETAALLADDPHNAQAFSIRALVLGALGRHKEALEAAVQARSLAPDEGYQAYVHAFVLQLLGRPGEARRALEEALLLDPHAVYVHHLLGMLALADGRWKEALAHADAGLAIAPTDLGCLALSAQALRRLDRLAEADERARLGLESHPDSAKAHETRGWIALQQGDVPTALMHFEETLRLDADRDRAREGLLTAMRAHVGPYRWFVRQRMRWQLMRPWQSFILVAGCVAALYLAAQASNPTVGGALILGLFATAIAVRAVSVLADPLLNVMLRLQPRGRWVLRPHQVWGANLLIGLLVAAAAFMPLTLLVGFTMPINHKDWSVGDTLLWLGIYATSLSLALALPVAITFEQREAGRRLRWMLGTGALALVGVASPFLAMIDPPLAGASGLMVMLACMIATFFAETRDAHAGQA